MNPLEEALARFRPADANERAALARAGELLVRGDPWDRRRPSHLTASALVVERGAHDVLLRFHERLGRWMQVGGHGDAGEDDPWEVALREAREETGLDDLGALSPGLARVIVQLAVVAVPVSAAEPPHEHVDLRYVLATAAPERATPEGPDAPLRWVRLADAAAQVDDEGLRVLIARLVAALAGRAARPGRARDALAMADGHEYHFDPATYLATVRAEVPAYDELQEEVARATEALAAAVILELGTGTGEIAGRVLARHRGARFVGIDESADMLALARDRLPAADLRVARLEDPLPEGRFDLVFSALTVHHLDGPAKAELFRRVAAVLAPGGAFVLADVVVPEDPRDVVTPVDGVYDLPSRVDEQLVWLGEAGLSGRVAWSRRDLAVVVATRDDD